MCDCCGDPEVSEYNNVVGIISDQMITGAQQPIFYQKHWVVLNTGELVPMYNSAETCSGDAFEQTEKLQKSGLGIPVLEVKREAEKDPDEGAITTHSWRGVVKEITVWYNADKLPSVLPTDMARAPGVQTLTAGGAQPQGVNRM